MLNVSNVIANTSMTTSTLKHILVSLGRGSDTKCVRGKQSYQQNKEVRQAYYEEIKMIYQIKVVSIDNQVQTKRKGDNNFIE